MKILNFCSNKTLKTAAKWIFLTPIAYLIVVVNFLILIVISPLFLHRYILGKIFPVFNKKIGKILTGRSSLFAIDNFSDPKFALGARAIFKGGEKFEEVFKAAEIFIEKRDSCGNLLRPECQQYVKKYFGYYWWVWEPNFNFRDHVFIIDEELNETQYINLETSLMKQAFLPKKSPWNIYIFKNVHFKKRPDQEVQEPSMVFIIKLHHSIGDGLSCFKFVAGFLEIDSTEFMARAKFPKLSVKDIIFKFVAYCLKAPVEGLEILLNIFNSSNAIRIPGNELTSIFLTASDSSVSVDKIKEIKRGANSTFIGILFTALAGGIMKYTKNKKKMPESIFIGLPLPLRGHPEYKLRNYMTAGYLKLPLNIRDPVERLRIIDKKLENLKNSTIPITNFIFMPIIGALPSFLIKFLCKEDKLATVGMTYLPGPEKPLKFKNHEIIDFNLLIGPFPGIGIILSMSTYLGKLSVNIEGDKAIFPKKCNVEELLDCVVNEFQSFDKFVV